MNHRRSGHFRKETTVETRLDNGLVALRRPRGSRGHQAWAERHPDHRAGEKDEGEKRLHFLVPKWLSLGLIVVIFALSLLYARTQAPPPDSDVIDDEAGALINEEMSGKRD